MPYVSKLKFANKKKSRIILKVRNDEQKKKQKPSEMCDLNATFATLRLISVCSRKAVKLFLLFVFSVCYCCHFIVDLH